MRKIIYLFCAFCLFATVVLSAEEVKFDLSENRVTISGEAYDTVTVIILSPEQNIEDIDDDDPPFYVRTESAVGKYVHTTIIPLDSVTGEYKVYAGQKGVLSGSFTHINAYAAQQFVTQQINTQTSVKGLAERLLLAREALGINPEHISPIAEDISKILIKELPFDDYVSFMYSFKYSETCVRISFSENDTNTARLIKENEDVLQIDYQADYISMNAKAQSKIAQLLKNGDYINISFKDVYSDNCIIARCYGAEYWEVLKELMINNAEVIGISLDGKYASLKNKNTVFTELMEETKNFNSFADIKTAFNLKVEKLSTVISSGGGGGIGGGNQAYSTVVLPVETVQDIKTISNRFADLAGYEWGEQAINELFEKGIINGISDDTFAPSEIVTRAQFAKMIAAAFELESFEADFTDVQNTDWFADYVSACVGAGIVYGSNGVFFPNDSVTRQDAAVMLFRALKYKGLQPKGEVQFNDSDDISEYAKEAVSAMASEGILKGVGNGVFMPNQEALRVQAAVMIYNALKQIEVMS